MPSSTATAYRGIMPTASELEGSKRSGLARAVALHGGFPRVAGRLGLTSHRQPPGYGSEETVDAAVRGHLVDIAGAVVMPTDYELRASGRADLSVAISRHGGGYPAVARRLGLHSSAPKPDGYWNDASVVDEGLMGFIIAHGTPGHMPTQRALSQAGRADLANAIARVGGGWSGVAGRLGLQLVEKPKNYWNDRDNVRAAILSFNGWRGRPGEMPTKIDLDSAREFGLGRAIEKLGGYPAVAAMFGLSTAGLDLGRTSRFEIILAHELMAFFDIDPADHKLRAGGKSYEPDIIIGCRRIIVEYDSFYWHWDPVVIERDKRKTEGLQRAGWRVIRVREEPLTGLGPLDVSVEKGRYKEACNRVLLRIQEILEAEIDGLDDYLASDDLRNLARSEEFIANLLRTRRGLATVG